MPSTSQGAYVPDIAVYPPGEYLDALVTYGFDVSLMMVSPVERGYRPKAPVCLIVSYGDDYRIEEHGSCLTSMLERLPAQLTEMLNEAKEAA